MKIISTLNEKLLKQHFIDDQDETVMLAKGQQIASGYATIENSIAVLSDLKSAKSYIYYGGFAEQTGMGERGEVGCVDSIWEEAIFRKIHPDDLVRKHVLELYFFHFLKSLPVKDRSDFHVVSKMRMMDNEGQYVTILHRMFYVCSCSSGSFWLSLCLYNFPYDKTVSEVFSGVIINSATGNRITPDREEEGNILSTREKEILELIDKGRSSKEIADLLFISKNTVSRHRQNILEKLRVKNSVEACRIAKLMELI